MESGDGEEVGQARRRELIPHGFVDPLFSRQDQGVHQARCMTEISLDCALDPGMDGGSEARGGRWNPSIGAGSPQGEKAC